MRRRMRSVIAKRRAESKEENGERQTSNAERQRNGNAADTAAPTALTCLPRTVPFRSEGRRLASAIAGKHAGSNSSAVAGARTNRE